MNCVNSRGPSDNSGMLQRPKPFGLMSPNLKVNVAEAILGQYPYYNP